MNSGIISKEEKLNQMKSKFDFKNIKSNYFLIKIFEIMNKNKYLNIIKYNKELQKRVNLTINDYIEYYQFYSPVEIEIKLDDKEHDENDKFINISDEDKEYYHIYFDNSNKEIKRNYLTKMKKLIRLK